MKSEFLEVVDDNGRVLRKESRKIIHRDGLLHKEIHVWFYTPQGELIFQHRAKDKDTYPDLLDATVGGHVEIGADYPLTAVKETFEETGLKLRPEDLKFAKLVHHQTEDLLTKTVNNALKAEFIYRYLGRTENLRIEKGKAVGFEPVALEKLLTASEQERKRFLPSIFLPDILEIFKMIKSQL